MNEKQFNTIVQLFAALSEQVHTLGTKIDATNERLDALEARIEEVNRSLSAKIDLIIKNLGDSQHEIEQRVRRLERKKWPRHS